MVGINHSGNSKAEAGSSNIAFKSEIHVMS